MRSRSRSVTQSTLSKANDGAWDSESLDSKAISYQQVGTTETFRTQSESIINLTTRRVFTVTDFTGIPPSNEEEKTAKCVGAKVAWKLFAAGRAQSFVSSQLWSWVFMNSSRGESRVATNIWRRLQSIRFRIWMSDETLFLPIRSRPSSPLYISPDARKFKLNIDFVAEGREKVFQFVSFWPC